MGNNKVWNCVIHKISEASNNQIKMGDMTQHPLMHQLEKT
jgi:hypothetical protein